MKLLIVEDEPNLLSILRKGFAENNNEVSVALDGKTALEMIHNYTFDVVILDVMLPDMDGFEIATAIRKRNQEIPILFLSAKTMKEDRIKGLKLGADDYLVKPYSMEELILKIEIFLNRSQKSAIKSNALYLIGSFEFDPANYCLTKDKTVTNLTEREAALLRLFLDNKNTVLKREKILMELWGTDDYFMGRSLDVFMSRLRKYLQHDNRIKLESVRGVGFRVVFPE